MSVPEDRGIPGYPQCLHLHRVRSVRRFVYYRDFMVLILFYIIHIRTIQKKLTILISFKQLSIFPNDLTKTINYSCSLNICISHYLSIDYNNFALIYCFIVLFARRLLSFVTSYEFLCVRVCAFQS